MVNPQGRSRVPTFEKCINKLPKAKLSHCIQPIKLHFQNPVFPRQSLLKLKHNTEGHAKGRLFWRKESKLEKQERATQRLQTCIQIFYQRLNESKAISRIPCIKYVYCWKSRSCLEYVIRVIHDCNII